jgi:hypothetical protein
LPVYSSKCFEREKETLKHAFLTVFQANAIMSQEPAGCRSEPQLNMKKNSQNNFYKLTRQLFSASFLVIFCQTFKMADHHAGSGRHWHVWVVFGLPWSI